MHDPAENQDLAELRAQLMAFMCRKFRTRPGVWDFANEIVNQSFLDVAGSADFKNEMYNFGYMAAACVRRAYKVFHKHDRESARCLTDAVPLIAEGDFVEEILHAENTAEIIASLQVLKEIERIIVHERYWGDFTFREISERHGIKLNTVLTHHRRALARLRPVLTNLWN